MTENKIMNIGGVDCYEKNGTAYLKLETVARGLGFTQVAASGNEVVRWERVKKYLAELSVPTSGDDTELPDYIPENVFYRLAMKAKNETAEKFQALVADEIIPAIRKNGVYMTENAADKILQDYDFIIRLATQAKEHKAQLEAAEQKIALDAPKVEYFDKAIERGDNLNIRDTAKVLGVKQNAFVNFLTIGGYIYRDSKKQIRPVAEYEEKGWFTLKEFGDKKYNGAQTLVTFKGRAALAGKIQSAKTLSGKAVQ